MTAQAGDTFDTFDAAALKAQLRRTFRARRAALSPRQRAQAARHAARLAARTPSLRQRQRIGAYWPVGAELDPRPLMKALLSRGVALYLPVIRPDQQLIWVRYRPGMPLKRGPHGIATPRVNRPRCHSAHLQALLVPLVAFDAHGTRLGAGGGYYDRLPQRPGRRPLRIGWAYACQRAESLPAEPWDIPLHRIATEGKPPWPTGS